MRRAATRSSADESTMAGLLHQSTRTQGVTCAAAAVMMTLARVVQPVKKMWSHCCCRSEVVSGTPPRTTENASRSRYSGTNRASTSEVATDTSEGLMTAALPPEIAAINGDNVSITG